MVIHLNHGVVLRGGGKMPHKTATDECQKLATFFVALFRQRTVVVSRGWGEMSSPFCRGFSFITCLANARKDERFKVSYL